MTEGAIVWLGLMFFCSSYVIVRGVLRYQDRRLEHEADLKKIEMEALRRADRMLARDERERLRLEHHE